MYAVSPSSRSALACASKPSMVLVVVSTPKQPTTVVMPAVTNSLNNIRWYEAELERTFQHLRACFPGKPILVVSVGDRATKEEGELVTMRGVPAIVAMQRDLAGKHGLLFFDLFMGMGGKGSMVALAHHRPRYANLDYTHLTHEGGKYMSRLFLRLLLEAQQKAKKLN